MVNPFGDLSAKETYIIQLNHGWLSQHSTHIALTSESQMPLHRFYIPRNTYSKEDKAALGKAITDIYDFLPTFYVVVLFIEVDKEDYFVGGKAVDNFVRVVVHHVSVKMGDEYVPPQIPL